MIVTMSTNTAYLGGYKSNKPFRYQKFRLYEIIDYRNGLANAGIPVSTTNNQKTNYNTIEALDLFPTVVVQ